MSSGKKISGEVVICIILGIVIVILAAIAFLVFRSQKPKSDAPSVVITNDMVYSAAIDTDILEKPTSGATVIAQAAAGTQLAFVSMADNGYYKVSIGSVSGYVNGDYVIDSELIKTRRDEQKTNMYIVNTKDFAAMRGTADTNGSLIANIALGTQVGVYADDEVNGMRLVQYDGTDGYVEQIYLSEDYALVQKQQELNKQEDEKKAQEAAEKERKANLPVGSNAVALKYPMWVCNVENAIYLRTNPSDNADVITTIPLNSQVYYIDTCEGSWYKISYNGQMGYSKAMYLTTSKPYTPPAQTTQFRTVTGVENSVYLRRNANSSTAASNIICEIPKGTVVTYLSTVGEYTRVRYNDSVGYILSKYLR